MATFSGKFYLVEGCKISLEILKAISDDVPSPGSSIVNLVSQVVAAVETAKSNQEQWDRLRNLLLSILPVIISIIKKSSQGKTLPSDLKQSVERLHKCLLDIVSEVTKIQTAVKSKRIRRKVAAVFFGNAHSSILKKCCDDLDWAMEEFAVRSRLGDAVRLCEVLEKNRTLLTNQLLLSLPRARYAGFDSERPDHPSECFEGTRTGILKDITDWMSEQNPEVQRVFWLKGIAGVGKTTVARTIAQQAQEAGILGAQFFFSRRGEAELRNPALVFSTIAYQLARFDPEFGERIVAALESSPDAAFTSLKDQLEKLVVEPLSNAQHDPGRVVMIIFDAFDECEANGAKQILQLLINAIPRLPFYLKILVTSRPEPHIQSVLVPSNNLHITALHDIEESIVKNDILLYLRARLRNLPKELNRPFSPDWITEEEISLLAEKAGNLFIHAATCLRFLSESLDLRAQLDILLEMIRSTRHVGEGETPFAYLDKLYLEILCGLITPTNGAEVARMFQSIVGSIVLLRDPLPVDALERLTGLPKGKTSHLLPFLQSVILPPVLPDQVPRVYHPSFPDFLQDANRCSDNRFHVDNKIHEARMALRCLHVISTHLRKGMLGDLDPTLLNSDLEDRENRVQTAFPPELQYACRYWAVHFLAATEGERSLEIIEALDLFAGKSLLPWMEAMSWLGDVRLCLRSLEAVNSWAAKNSCLLLTKSLLNDGHRMLLAHFSTINASAQHIARSVFPFLPRNIPLLSNYSGHIDPAVTVLCGVDSEWPAYLAALKSHSDTVRSVTFSHDGSQLASASDDETIHVCDVMGGGSLVVLQGHIALVLDVAFCPDGSRLASASSDSTVRIWDTINTSCTAVLEGHPNEVNSVSFSPDGFRLASASADTTVRIWDMSAARYISTLRGHSSSVRSVVFSPDGMRLASGSDDQTIRVWDAVRSDCLTTFCGHSDRVGSVIFFPDGSRLASASDDKTVRLWDVATGKYLVILDGHSDKVYCLAVSPDGTRLASGSYDTTIRVWNTTSHACINILVGHSNSVTSLSFSPDGSRLASGSADATVRIWDALITNSSTWVQGHSRCVKSVTFSPDGLRVASGSNDKTIRIWSAVTGDILATLEGHTDWVETVAWSPDGLHLASGSSHNDASVRLWDLATEGCLVTFNGHSDHISGLAFSPDGTRLASGSADNTARIWDIALRRCVATLQGHSNWAISVAFSPDGSRLVSGSFDRTVRVWDVVEGTCLTTLHGHTDPVLSVKFSLNGSLIISTSGSQDGNGRWRKRETRVWNPEPSAPVDVKQYEAGARTDRQLECEDGKLYQLDPLGSRLLICIIPTTYRVETTDFHVPEAGRARVALGCESGAVVILEVDLS